MEKKIIIYIFVSALVFGVLGYYLGVMQITNIQTNQDNITPAAKQTTNKVLTNQEVQSNPPIVGTQKGEDDINAQKVQSLNVNQQFNLSDFSKISFQIKDIYKATGGKPALHCGNYSDGIFVRFIPNSDSSGVCLFTSRDKIDGKTASLVALDIEINNNGSQEINGNFFKLLYQNDQSTDRIADNINDAFKSYGAKGLSDESYRLVFKIPQDLNKFEITFGNFNSWNQEVTDVRQKIEGGYQVDFEKNTVSSTTHLLKIQY
jgi:hypothetical protein